MSGKSARKVFAIGGWADGQPAFTFKVSDISYELLKQQPGLRPAPYLASRGMKWIQHYAESGALGRGIEETIFAKSHRIVAQGLTRKSRRELGLDET